MNTYNVICMIMTFNEDLKISPIFRLRSNVKFMCLHCKVPNAGVRGINDFQA